MVYKHVALIGLGLIASSIALAIKRGKLTTKVTATSRSKSTRSKASDLGICNVVSTLQEAVKDADLIILCVPVGAMEEVFQEIAPFLKSGSTLTDVGSVKASIVDQIMPNLPKDVHFIPGHPIAGTEHSGPEAGLANLFDERWCILTPSNDTKPEILKNLISFWENLGARVDTMEPEHHDLVLAVTSHAPHLIAFTMVGVANDLENVTKSEIINYSAAGFRDFTRIAASDPTMWRDVFLRNKEASLKVLDRFTEELFLLRRAIIKEDGDYLHEYFSRTRAIRRRIIDAGQDTGEPDFGRGKT